MGAGETEEGEEASATCRGRFQNTWGFSRAAAAGDPRVSTAGGASLGVTVLPPGPCIRGCGASWGTGAGKSLSVRDLLTVCLSLTRPLPH